MAMTEAEKVVLQSLVDAWNAYIHLPQEHGDDLDEFRAIIHTAQNHIAARSVWRELRS
ncbi:MAG: hypothetical protein KYX66_12465 [Blastomonas fulva]|uniref:hypothetical protein n=1 Tax=Blastomonas fulva TaxID=1550728 RepID=UPI0024E26777|nr:hypothetical protein [Blastomonas fulva]MDK2757539.1 hypothetical protein [Blastomonas fulva]